MDKFTLHTSFYEPIRGMSDKQLGRLLRAIFAYHIDGSTKVDSDLAMAFGFFRSHFEIEETQRMRIAERNRRNGSKGGRPKAGGLPDGEETQKTHWVIEKPKKPSGLSGFSHPPSSPSSLSPEPPITTPPISPSSTTTTTPAYTREEQFPDWDEGIDDLEPKEKSCAKKEIPSGTYIASEHLVEVLLADRRWVANVAKNKCLTEEVVRNLVIEFCTQIELTEDGKELSDAKRHFINWLRKKPNGQQAQQRPTRSYQNPEPDFRSVAEAVARGIAAARTNQG